MRPVLNAYFVHSDSVATINSCWSKTRIRGGQSEHVARATLAYSGHGFSSETRDWFSMLVVLSSLRFFEDSTCSHRL